MIYKSVYIIFICFLPYVLSYQKINLGINNTIVLRGEITHNSADTFLYDILSKDVNSNTIIYINSPGGSVLAGQRILQYIKQYKLTCITDKAYSMAFVIFQACYKRYITDSATMMQHQQSLGIEGNLYTINNQLSMINTIEEELNIFQSEKIQIPYDEFKLKISTEWWLYGKDILNNKVADDIVYVSCCKELVNTNISIFESTLFGTYENIYSACPLIVNPLSTKQIKPATFSFM